VAASGLEQCLWDLAGRALGVPTYDLFGGRIHDRIRLYANINRSTDPRTPEGFAAMARAGVEAGFDAFKLAPFDALPMGLEDRSQVEGYVSQGLACAQAVRDAIGSERDLLIDAHSRFTLAEGLDLLERVKPLNLFWLEEVTPADPPTDLAAINRAATMKTAGGEAIYGVEGFYAYLKADAVDIAMPDVKLCGGMMELKKIAAIAEGAGLPVSPHGPASPIGNIAAAQVMATVPNFNILEFSFGEVPWRAELLRPEEDVTGGSLALSSKPGFGVDLDDTVLAKRGGRV
jgi:galactonate dehydratase